MTLPQIPTDPAPRWRKPAVTKATKRRARRRVIAERAKAIAGSKP